MIIHVLLITVPAATGLAGIITAVRLAIPYGRAVREDRNEDTSPA